MFITSKVAYTQQAALRTFSLGHRFRFFSTRTAAHVAEYLFFDSHAAKLFFSDSRYAQAIVNTPKVQCFVTETTQNQLLRQGITQQHLENSPLKRVNSGIHEQRKRSALSMVNNLLKNPKVERPSLQQAFYELTEASGCCYNSTVTPSDDFTPPIFITANTLLYRQLLAKPVVVEHFHDVMNLCGLDFLIRSLRLKDCFALLKCAHPKGNCIAEEIDFRRNPDDSNILFHVQPHDRHKMEASINAYQCALYACEWGDLEEAEKQIDKSIECSFVGNSSAPSY